jgi:hypothetical protein
MRTISSPRDFERSRNSNVIKQEEDRLMAIRDRAHNAKVYEQNRLDAIQKQEGYATMDAFLGLSCSNPV